jgi:hypothetical protein
MPRTDNAGLPAFFDFAFMEGPGQVAAGIRQDVYGVAPAEHEQRHPGYHPPLQFFLNELLQRRQDVPTDREAVRNILAVVYAGSLTIREVATEETGGGKRRKPKITEQLASWLPPAGPLHQRRDIQTGGREVPRGVDQAHALLLFMKFRPVGEAGHSGRNRADDPHANQYAGRPVASGHGIQDGG